MGVQTGGRKTVKTGGSKWTRSHKQGIKMFCHTVEYYKKNTNRMNLSFIDYNCGKQLQQHRDQRL